MGYCQKYTLKEKAESCEWHYSHRLSGLVYCADCGARMGFISPEANHSEKRYDSDSAFQCGNYRSKSGECVSHYVKTSVLEAAILQAIQAVSKYVLENEEEFIQQLKAVWNEQQTKTANSGYQELAEAKKRMAELDEKINKLYESTLSGLLPERQAQRMIQQYDEEQILLEKRVAELENLVQQDEIKHVDASRFIALVKKYRDCKELTDTMLYAFIDRIEVHEATGGRTIYRQQNIDIHFNFIGNYYPPVEAVSEEERIAAIEAEQLRKKQEKGKRSEERRKQKLYASQLEEKERIKREKMLEKERKRIERGCKKKKLTRAELKEKAKTDPEAAKQLEAMRAKEAEARQRKKEREEARMAADPEYAAMMEARKKEYIRTRTAKRKAEHEALVELAKTDEEAARKLAEKRKYQSEATVKCYQKLKADAEAGDPEAIKRYEAHLAKRREDYHKKKAEKEDIPA